MAGFPIGVYNVINTFNITWNVLMLWHIGKEQALAVYFY
jgi:hypothetical protein